MVDADGSHGAPGGWFLAAYLVTVAALIVVALAVASLDFDWARRQLAARTDWRLGVGTWSQTTSGDGPLWRTERNVEMVAPFSAGAGVSPSACPRTFRTTVARYRSRTAPGRYGVRTVDTARTGQRRFLREVVDYRRTNVLYVPESSADTVSCDTWAQEAREATRSGAVNASQLVTCRPDEGTDACFKCRESRRYKRVCVHFPVDQTIVNSDGVEHVIPANEALDEGWCLPAAFKDIQFEESGSGSAPGRPPPEIARNCNPNTGDWLLSSLTASGSSITDSSYNWVCRCRYPNLMTNLDNALSDCLKPVGCQPHGRLDDRAAAGLVDPYRSGSCVCDRGYKPDFLDDVGPVCSPASVLEYGVNRVLDEVLGDDRGPVLDVSYVSRAFLQLLPSEAQQTVRLPNPCLIDALSGRALPAGESCELRRETIDKQERVFCVSAHVDYVAVRGETDYLLNNHGRYANACLFTGLTAPRPGLGQVLAEAPGAAFHLSYYNVKRFPDVAHVVNPALFRSGSEEQRRGQQILRFLDHDRDYQNWYNRFILPYPSYATRSRYPLRFNASELFRVYDSFVVYNDFPDIDRRLTFAQSLDVVPFQRQLYEVLLRLSPTKCSPKAIMTLIDRDILHPKRFTTYGIIPVFDVYVDMTVRQYIDFTVEPRVGNCLGRGTLVEGKTIDTEYQDVPDDPAKMRSGLRQYFVSANQSEYPTDYSSSAYVGGPNPDGSIADEIARDTKLMWPVVVHGNRKLCPNHQHRTFDATVQVFFTTNFMFISTTGLCANFMDYRSPKNLQAFENRPVNLTDYLTAQEHDGDESG